MFDKPTFASVTRRRCKCNYLEAAADDPSSPIVFDRRTSEYHFSYVEAESQTPAMLVIYHCPFCGGAAPKSKRHLLFQVVSRPEEQRLAALLKPIKTLDDAVKLLGAPDWDDHSVSRQREQEDQPPVSTFQRKLRYGGLSDVADVWISEGRDGKAYWQLFGKPVDSA